MGAVLAGVVVFGEAHGGIRDSGHRVAQPGLVRRPVLKLFS